MLPFMIKFFLPGKVVSQQARSEPKTRIDLSRHPALGGRVIWCFSGQRCFGLFETALTVLGPWQKRIQTLSRRNHEVLGNVLSGT